MYKRLSILLLLAAALAQNTGGDLESVISQIFGKPPGGGAAPGPAATPPPPPNRATFAPVTNAPAPQASTLVPGVGGGADNSGDLSCTTENNEAGLCVKYYLCDVNNNTINTDGIGIIDIRLQNGACAHYLDTCCLLPNTRVPDNPITPKPPPVTQVRQGCGWRNPQGVDMRTIGDTAGEAKFGEFPWMVAILKIEPVNKDQPTGTQLNVYVGGGSLIDRRVVLTTAHHVAKVNRLRVRAGEWDTQTTKEIHPYQDRDVESIVTHKDFNGGNLFYDIALLFLATPVDDAPNVGIACLPPPSDEGTQGDARCFASGWGRDKFGKDGRYQVILKKIELPLVEHRECRRLLRKTRLGNLFELHHTFMCAGGEAGKDTCRGDGGSPLVCPIEFQQDRYVQNGMVAWGIGCGEDGTPGVYVDVSILRNWIDNQILGKGIENLEYAKY